MRVRFSIAARSFHLRLPQKITFILVDHGQCRGVLLTQVAAYTGEFIAPLHGTMVRWYFRPHSRL
jgi:hypothetical protein